MSEYIHELSSIEKEIANLRGRLQQLTEKKKNIEANILKSMTENGETEIVIKGRKFYIEEFSKTKRPPKKIQEQSTLILLREYGLDSSQAKQVIDHMESMKKPIEIANTIKLRETKN